MNRPTMNRVHPAFPNPSARRLPFAALLASLATGCALAQAPTLDDGVTETSVIIDPDTEHPTAQIALTQQGLWALVRQGDRSPESLQVGQLLHIESHQDAPFSEFFAVAESHAWGATLQRLGGGPVPTSSFEATVNLVHPEDVTGACVGDAPDWSQTPCISLRPDTTAWDVYRRDGDRLHRRGAPTARRATMPFQPFALGTRTPLAPDHVESDQPTAPAPWFAMPRAHTRPPVSIASRVLAAPSCEPYADTLTHDNLSLEWANPGALTSAIEVELAAAKAAVDLIVVCGPRDITLYAPAALRPLMPMRGIDVLSVPLLTWSPRKIALARSQAVRHAVVALASLAAGRFDRAHLRLTSLVDLVDGRGAHPWALLTSQVAAAAGLPEHSLRLREVGSRRLWNPTRNPSYLLASATFWASMERPREALSQMRALDEVLARQPTDSSLRIWRIWGEVRAFSQAYDHRSSSEDGFQQARSAFEDIQGAQSWREAVDWLRWQQVGGATPDAQRGSDERFQLFRDVAAGSLHGACERCPLDPFGLNLQPWLANASSPSAITQLGRSPRVAVRPGFVTLSASTSPQARLASALLAPDWASSTLLDRAWEKLARGFTCADEAAGAYDSLHALLLYEVSRSDRADLAALHDVLSVGLRLACDEPDQALDVLRRLARTPRSRSAKPAAARWAAQFAAGIAERGLLGPLSIEDATTLADLSLAGGATDQCLAWSQAAALAALRVDDHEAAQRLLLQAGQCPRSSASPDLLASESFLGALVYFNRTRSVPSGLAPQVSRRLATAVRHRVSDDHPCPGLAPLAYRLDTGVSKTVARLAQEVGDEGTPTIDGEFRILTAVRTATAARRAYQEALVALREARPDAAAQLLRRAGQDFASIAHLPGLKRVALLRSTLFDDAAGSDPLVELIRSGRAADIFDVASDAPDPRASLVAALVLDMPERADQIVQSASWPQDHPFCSHLLGRETPTAGTIEIRSLE